MKKTFTGYWNVGVATGKNEYCFRFRLIGRAETTSQWRLLQPQIGKSERWLQQRGGASAEALAEAEACHGALQTLPHRSLPCPAELRPRSQRPHQRCGSLLLNRPRTLRGKVVGRRPRRSQSAAVLQELPLQTAQGPPHCPTGGGTGAARADLQQRASERGCAWVADQWSPRLRRPTGRKRKWTCPRRPRHSRGSRA